MWTLIPNEYRGYDIWTFASYVDCLKHWAKHYPRYREPSFYADAQAYGKD